MFPHLPRLYIAELQARRVLRSPALAMRHRCSRIARPEEAWESGRKATGIGDRLLQPIGVRAVAVFAAGYVRARCGVRKGCTTACLRLGINVS